MNAESSLLELVALLDRLNDPPASDVLREIQMELDFLIARHSMETKQNG